MHQEETDVKKAQENSKFYVSNSDDEILNESINVSKLNQSGLTLAIKK